MGKIRIKLPIQFLPQKKKKKKNAYTILYNQRGFVAREKK